MENNSNNVVTIISLAIGGLAFIISILDLIIAKRALALSENDANGRKPLLIPYLIDSFAFNYEKQKLYAFNFSICNRSDNDNSIMQVDLIIEYGQSQSCNGNFIIPHVNTNLIKLPGNPPFSIPLNIGAHQTISGWGIFKIEDNLIEQKRIDEYKIRIKDSFGKDVWINPIVIQEKNNNEEQIAS